MKERKLLSIVVPTKNRTVYLKSFIQVIDSFHNDNIELVIQDNSDDNQDILSFLDSHNFKNIVYNYCNHKLSVVDNSNLAIQKASGKYICFMGDDDFVSEKLYNFVVYMSLNGYESAIFKKAQYYWPGVSFKRHNFPSLIIEKKKKYIKEINVKKELKKLLNKGATSLGLMPQLYHGVILREKLEEVFKVTKTYFPGPSPDMAVSIGLAHFVNKHIYCTIPFISAGASPKSAAGLGTQHKHKGEISKISFLPVGTEERWNKNIPKIWTGPTIYVQSVYEGLLALNRQDLLKKINYNYHYAFFKIFCKSNKNELYKLKNTDNYKGYLVFIYGVGIFLQRLKRYFKNIFICKFKKFAITSDNVENSLIASKMVDEKIGSLDIEKLFLNVRKK